MDDETQLLPTLGTELHGGGSGGDRGVSVLREPNDPGDGDPVGDKAWDVEEYARQQYAACFGDVPAEDPIIWLQQQINTLWTGQHLLDNSAHKALEALKWHDSALSSVASLLDSQKAESRVLRQRIDSFAYDVAGDFAFFEESYLAEDAKWRRQRLRALVFQVVGYIGFIIALYQFK